MTSMIQILIEMDETTGQVSIKSNIPLQNRMAWYGLLGIARDYVQQSAAQPESRVQLAPPGMQMPKLKDS